MFREKAIPIHIKDYSYGNTMSWNRNHYTLGIIEEQTVISILFFEYYFSQ